MPRPNAPRFRTARAPGPDRAGYRGVPVARRAASSHRERWRDGAAHHGDDIAGQFRADVVERRERCRRRTRLRQSSERPRPRPMNWPPSIEIGRQLSRPPTLCASAVGEAQGHKPPDRRAGAGRAQDRRRHQTHPRYRRTDQPAGAQRHHRSGPCRRRRQRLRGRLPPRSNRRRADRKATEDISTLITAVQIATTGAVGAIGRLSVGMQDIDNCTTAVVSAIEQQSSATSGNLQNVADAAGGTRKLAAMLDDVAGAATQTAQRESVLTAAQAVEAAAAELRRRSRRLPVARALNVQPQRRTVPAIRN